MLNVQSEGAAMLEPLIPDHFPGLSSWLSREPIERGVSEMWISSFVSAHRTLRPDIRTLIVLSLARMTMHLAPSCSGTSP
jgi:hypothetical protein